MGEQLAWLEYGGWFLVVLTAVVFVHEWGHYLVARLCGVKVEVFSVGFGRELFGFTDRHGTRWRISLLPVGGYVRFLDEHPQDDSGGEIQPKAVPEGAFSSKGPGARAAVMAAGPGANFAFAIVLLFGLYFAVGRPVTAPVVGEVVAGSVAEEAGFLAGDRIIAVDGRETPEFRDIVAIVSVNPDRALAISIERDGTPFELLATPQPEEWTDIVGEIRVAGRLGVRSIGTEIIPLSPAAAFAEAVVETARFTGDTLSAFGEMIVGKRSTGELGGPILIAQVSGKVADQGVFAFLVFMALLSVNLGLINLFPIPILDGGQLVFVGIETFRGRPLSERVRLRATTVGFTLVMGLMVFVVVNDIARIFG